MPKTQNGHDREPYVAEVRETLSAARGLTHREMADAGIAPSQIDRIEDQVIAIEALRALRSEIPHLLNGDDARAVAERVFWIGFEMGIASEQRRLAKAAAGRRSPQRPRVEALLLEGKTGGQIERMTGASERTIKRIRSEMKAAGRLPSTPRGHS